MLSPSLCLLLASIVLVSAAENPRFTSWASTHEPSLLNSTDHEAIFTANAAIVAELAIAHPDAEFTLDESPFAHLTFAQFASARLPKMGRVLHAATTAATTPSMADASPSAFDWRTNSVKAVTPVKDQGAMGSCWAFSTVGNIEGQRAIASQGATLESLSVEQLVECDDTVGVRSVDGVMEGSCGVFGGWPYLAYEWLIKAGGVRTDKSMPYCSGIQYGQPGGCLPCMTKGYNTTLCGNHSDLFCNTSTTLGQGPKGLCKSAEGSVAQLKGWRRVGNNATAIADELVATGPLSIALDATIAFQFYKRGVLRPSSHPILGGCGKDPELNHAVLLVGYGTDGGKDYWTIKNSWGSKWGEEGYFRFIRGTDKCGVESEVTTAILA